jgi:hypothetical protein
MSLSPATNTRQALARLRISPRLVGVKLVPSRRALTAATAAGAWLTDAMAYVAVAAR